MKSSLVGTTYLLHFDSPIGHSRHYLGWTVDLAARIELHRSGYRDKCVLTHEASLRGIGFVLARTWPAVRIEQEKRLKRQRNGPRFCPICNPNLLLPTAAVVCSIGVESLGGDTPSQTADCG